MNKTYELTPDKKVEILENAETLIKLYKAGALGGKVMPEDANPHLQKDSDENYLYFTLPMALNYQRNSYKLWESAQKTYFDAETSDVFVPIKVVAMEIDQLREKLTKYKIAIQPNKHPLIWMELCKTFISDFNGSVKEFFKFNHYSVEKTKNYIMNHKKQFPYLSGAKIMNYWLYVMEQYTDVKFIDREKITVAPDTHVIQASVKLGLINNEDINENHIREIVSDLWNSVFIGTNRCPIDIHTPLWLWSRNGFSVKVGNTEKH
ncbi:MAG: hypothetical protein Q8876_09125 [Bacillota bacterium]|nr:hypothetical protein [Bacillota bacterium]